jgi:hypothetical protein
VYSIELVRHLCRAINNASADPEKEQDLLSLLQAVIKDDQEEIKIRAAFLAQKYAITSDAKAAD